MWMRRRRKRERKREGRGGEREEDVCFSEERYSRWNSDGEGRKGSDEAGFLVYRGINPYPQLPFVLGAAWSTC